MPNGMDDIPAANFSSFRVLGRRNQQELRTGMHIPIRFAVMMAALLLLLANPLLAQREDIPLSPLDRGYRMVAEARVERADFANGQIAVVWGTTELTPDSALRAVFYVQLVRDGKSVGRPVKVGDSLSKFSGSIRIAAIGNNFLVLYSDLSRYGAFSQFFDTRTVSLGTPYKIAREFADVGTYVWMRSFGGNDAGWRILWPSDNGLWTCHFDSLGVPTEESWKIDAHWANIIPHPFLSDILMIGGSMLEPIHILNKRTGALTAIGAPHYSEPFHLGADTSMMVLRDSTLYLYKRFGDSVPLRMRHLPLSEWNVIPAQGLLWGDRQGKIMLHFLVAHRRFPEQQRHAGYSILRVRMDSLAGALMVDTLPGDSFTVGNANDYLDPIYSRAVGCDNQALVELSFSYPFSSIESVGALLLDGTGKISFVKRAPDIAGCRSIYPILAVERPQNDSLSIAELHLADTIALSLPVARRNPPPHLSPGIIPFPGSLACTWREADTILRDVQGRWDIRENMVRDQEIYIPPPRVDFDGTLRDAKRIAWDTSATFPGNVGLAYNYTSEGFGVMYRSARDPEWVAPVATSRYAFARPGEDGWVQLDKIIQTASWIFEPNHIKRTGTVIGYDPDYSTIVVLIRRYESWQNLSYSLYSYHSAGISWQLDGLPGVGEKSVIIPMGAKGYITIDSSRGMLVREGKIAGSFDISSAGRLKVKYHKIYGGRFARTSWDASDTTRFHLEIFDTLGTRLHAVSMNLQAETNDYMLMPSPADSSITLLFGGDRGVRGVVLKKNLVPVVVDTLLSATTGRVSHPAGAFRGDTLFLVWEDYRGEVSRIYGTYHSGSWLPSSVEEKREDIPAVDGMPLIYPNPAGNAMTITASTGNEEGLLFDMSDLLGREVLRGRIMEAETSVDISGIPSGTYIVRVWKDGRSRSQVVIKR